MLPDLFPTFLLILIKPELTGVYQLRDLFRRERAEIEKDKVIAVAGNYVVGAKYPTHHVLRDLAVVLDLALVSLQDLLCDLANRTPAPIAKQRLDHHWLINVGHPHSRADEVK
jgi:hypothetical protein